MFLFFFSIFFKKLAVNSLSEISLSVKSFRAFLIVRLFKDMFNFYISIFRKRRALEQFFREFSGFVSVLIRPHCVQFFFFGKTLPQIARVGFFQRGNVVQNDFKFFLKFSFLFRGQIYSGQFRQFFNFHNYPNNSRTTLLTKAPSALPLTCGARTAITFPISFSPFALDCSTAFYCSANCNLPAFSKASMGSFLFCTTLETTCETSSSLSADATSTFSDRL